MTKRIIFYAIAALALLGLGLFTIFSGDKPAERAALYALVILTWLSLLGVVLIYGLLTPWYKSRTGIGFMSTKVSFLTIISLTIVNALWFKTPTWLSILAWAFVIITINFGITWNILYKQFFEHRADQVSDKTKTTQQNGVHDTGKEHSHEH
jgi:hypothetical protein